MTPLTVTTERLTLIACTAPVAWAASRGRRRQTEALLGVRIHPDWPGPDIRSYLPVYAQMIRHDPTILGWGLWLIAHRADQIVIGDIGFKGKPDSTGTVDIGYGIVPTYRRQHYAFEAASALRDWAFAQPGVRRLTGDCLPENVASARILERLGMRQIGQTLNGLLLWEMTREPGAVARHETEAHGDD